MAEPLAAVILAGGASRRMGRDKATMAHPRVPGVTMVEHTVAVLADRCDPVLVVAAPDQSLPDLDAVVLRDEVGGAGPLVATGLGLRAAANAGSQRAFVCAVDMPDLAAGLVDVLAHHSDADVVLPWDGREHYLAGVYRTALADRIEELVATGARSMRALSDRVPTVRVELPASTMLTNLNEPGDLG